MSINVELFKDSYNKRRFEQIVFWAFSFFYLCFLDCLFSFACLTPFIKKTFTSSSFSTTRKKELCEKYFHLLFLLIAWWPKKLISSNTFQIHLQNWFFVPFSLHCMIISYKRSVQYSPSRQFFTKPGWQVIGTWFRTKI